ncbi:sperm-associated antigen 5 isoform X2 [Rhinoderma darwinii]|uniref:sperm-associated antigen 5 isoform X2 n=1 Tax=Rhinoderma darwinii TaxID=43563 RepID=UPI003F67C4F5
MWSPDNPICDENQILAEQNVHRKSVGRTPLKVLDGQHLAVLDANTLVNKSSSQCRTSNKTAVTSKESTRVSVGTPVSVWIDPCFNDGLENRTSCSLLEPVMSEGKSLTLPPGPENCDQFNQWCDIAELSQPMALLDRRTSSDNKDTHSLLVNEVADRLHVHYDQLTSSPFLRTTHERQELQACLTLEDDTCQEVTFMSGEPEGHDDPHGVLIPGSSLKHITELDKIALPNINSNDEDNVAANVLNPTVLHRSEHDIFLHCARNDSQLDLLLTDKELDLLDSVEDVSEPHNVMSANDTYEINHDLNVASEQSSATVTDELSEVTEIIENWNLSIKDNEGFFQNEPAGDEAHVEGCPPVETLSSSPPGTVMNDFKETQLLSGSPERLDHVVCHNSGRSLPDTLPIDDSLLTEVLFHDPERSSCRMENYTTETSANKGCTAVDGLTTDHALIGGDSTPLTDTKCFFPISNMDQICQSNSRFDQGKLVEDTQFTEICRTPMMQNNSNVHKIPLLNRGLFKNVTPRMFASPHEAGTPVLTSDGVTWTTPMMLLNKSMNTSCDFIGKSEKSAKDNASETDSVLWNFSREALCNASRDELMYWLEGTLIVVEVLSRQIQGWQQIKVSSNPSEQRESSTQTCVTYTSTEEQYNYDLYLKTLSELQSVQHSQEQEQTLHQPLKEATDTLAGHCLQDLETHASAVITPLQRDLESERKLCESVKEASEQQSSYIGEFAEFEHRTECVFSEVEEDRTQLQRQCSQARELMSQHWRLFEVMKEKTQSTLEAYEGIKMERDVAVQENNKVCSHLRSIESHTEQVKLDNSRLGSELELLMDRLCTLNSEIEQLTEENVELEELLSAKDSSMRLIEKELNEATARGQEYQDRIKQLTGQVLPSLEKDLSKTLNQKQALQKHLEVLKKEHASQISYYTEILEFLEQENIVCREQVLESESQLKTHHRTVLDRNFKCENLKDTIKELQKEISDLQGKLSHSQEDAQSRIMKLTKEISDSSVELSKIKSHVLERLGNLKEATKTEEIESLPGSQTPGRNLVLSKDEELTATNINTAGKRESIWSKTSAFTVVLPVTSPSAGTPEKRLPDIVVELSSIVADVVTTSSNAMEKKRQIIQGFKMEISSLKEELQSQRFQHMSEMRVLQEEFGNLKRRNCILDEKVTSKEKCISELQEVVNQQEQKILQQFSKAKKKEVLIQENTELQVSLKVCEKEVEVLKQELSQNSTEAARNWIMEKLLLHKDLTTLRLKLVDTEYSKSEAIQRLMRHKDILAANLALSEAEVRKLDNIIVRIRQVLLSIPDVVNQCDKLKQLNEFLN